MEPTYSELQGQVQALTERIATLNKVWGQCGHVVVCGGVYPIHAYRAAETATTISRLIVARQRIRDMMTNLHTQRGMAVTWL